MCRRSAMVVTHAWPIDRERIRGLEVERPTIPKFMLAVEIDAELLDDVALHFGNRDLQHDLVAPAHRKAVHDLSAPPASRVARSFACCASAGLGDDAGQHDAVAEAFDVDVARTAAPASARRDAVEIARYRDVVGGDLRPSASKKKSWSGRPRRRSGRRGGPSGPPRWRS